MAVKRRRFIRSYAGFTLSAAKHTIEPLTEKAHQYVGEFMDKRIGVVTGTLRGSLTSDVKGMVGAVKVNAPHAHLLEYGTSKMRARPFMRPGKNKALREIKKAWKEGLKEAYVEQSN